MSRKGLKINGEPTFIMPRLSSWKVEIKPSYDLEDASLLVTDSSCGLQFTMKLSEVENMYYNTKNYLVDLKQLAEEKEL